jgi:8-oxo-dGTP diphosphatase
MRRSAGRSPRNSGWTGRRAVCSRWTGSRRGPEGLIVVYDGGVPSDAEIKEIALTDGELAGFAFVSRDEVEGLVTPQLVRRIASCLDAVTAGTVAAPENGSPAA